MKLRQFGRDDIKVSEVGLGCWQLGDKWGDVTIENAFAILEEAIAAGVTLFDTADVYGDGRSEKIIGDYLRTVDNEIFIATKVGRSAELFPDRYSESRVKACIEGSLKRLKRETIDLIQLHCVPYEVLKQGKIFDWMRTLVKEGKIQRFGASVESMAEAQLCIDQAPELYSLQVIFNIFRQNPVIDLFSKAKEKNIAIIARLPLASGLLTGKFDLKTTFSEFDHRHFNRDGKFFNVGETFAGLPYEKAIELVKELKSLLPQDCNMTQAALRWILDYDAVSLVIPGASKKGQVRVNAQSSEMEPLDEKLHQILSEFYKNKVNEHIRGPQ